MDVCYTASVRRTHFDHRLSVVGNSEAEIVEHLKAFLASEGRPGMATGQRVHGQLPKIVFVFSGQGPQWRGMGLKLMEDEPVFRKTIEECDSLLRPYADWSLLEELTREESSSRLHETAIAQPALFALQVALAALWRSWGVEPQAVVGHSMGEVAAAHLSGALPLQEAVRVIFHRGRCMDLAASKGRMLSVGLPVSEAEQVIQGFEDLVSVAAINSPTSATLSGDTEALQEISDLLVQRGIFCRFLAVNYAFHSPQMEPVKRELLASLDGLAPSRPDLPILSTVTGKPGEDRPFDKHYWLDSVRECVRFAEAVNGLIERSHDVFLELSPHPVLSVSISECLHHRSRKGAVLPSLRRKEDDRGVMLASLGALYTLGHPIDWQKLWAQGGRCVRLPKHPWQRQRYWHESEEISELRLKRKRHPLLTRRVRSADPMWETPVQRRVLSYLEDHRIQNHVVFPAAAYVEMAVGAGQDLFGEGACALDDIQFQKAFVLPDGDIIPTMQFIYHPADGSFAIHSRNSQSDQSWMLHTIGYLGGQLGAHSHQRVDLTALKNDMRDEVPVADCYDRFASVRVDFGPSFRGVEGIWRRDKEALGRVRIPSHLESAIDHHCFHPAFLDSCFQVLFGAVPEGNREINKVLYLPAQIAKVRYYGRPGQEAWSHAHITHLSPTVLQGDIRIYDEDGCLLIELEGFHCRAVKGTRGDREDGFENWLYEVNWKLKPLEGLPATCRSAAFIPNVGEIAERVEGEVRQWDSRISCLAMVPKAADLLDVLSTAYIIEAMRALGWPLCPGERATLGTLMERLNVTAQHRQLVRRFMQILEEARYLTSAGPDEWRMVQDFPEQDPKDIWRQVLSSYPASIAPLTLIGRCGSHLPAVLRSEIHPLQVIFPDGSTATAEHLYQDSPSTRIFNTIIQRVISCVLGRLPEGRTVRILEAGGGTGGTTSYALTTLPANRAEYVFSDISQAFLSNAEQKFREYPFVTFRLLDIEKDPLDQGFEPNSFDLVLASDVLHATRDIRDALRNILKLLSSEGLFVFLELARARPWGDLVFGLTEGWWRLRDFELRPDHPFSGTNKWEGVLREAGFTEVAYISLSPDQREVEQVVMLARRPTIRDDVHVISEEVPAPNADREIGGWLVFADSGGVAQKVVERLTRRGDTCWTVTPGECFEQESEQQFKISVNDSHDMERLLELVTAPSRPAWRGAIHLWSLDTPPLQDTGLYPLQRGEALGCYSTIHFLQALSKFDSSITSPRLVLVTRAAQPVDQNMESMSISQSPLVGLGRVITNEYPNIRCKVVDLGPRPSAVEIESLLAELWTEDTEEEVALRDEARFVPRLERAAPERVPAEQSNSGVNGSRPFRLEISTPGVIDHLVLRQSNRRHPGPQRVEIEVYAASVSFRDIMKALALDPVAGGDHLVLGDECAGRIVAVGEAVEGFHVGDEVIAIAPASIGSHATTSASLVMRKPSHLSFEAAVTMPITFLTAVYALQHLARIRAGERVLIHAAAGGVGLAAVQVAKQFDAEVFATAGSREKRELLRSLGLQHVLDSRSLSFADEIMEITAGRGVDVVLNSLAGKAIAKGLSCLAPKGRFLEIGKRDIYQDSKMGLWAFRKNLSFFAIDLSRLIVEDLPSVQAMLSELSQRIQDKTFYPLPHRVFPVSRSVGAFQHMAQARHMGKVVISMKEHGILVAPLYEEKVVFRPDSTYLITGGFGGFGLTLARWIIENGGRHLLLMGRSGARSEEDEKILADLQSSGAQVVAAKADVASEQQVRDLLNAIEERMPPLKGIFHAAMVLDDGVLLQLDQKRFRRVMAPKMDGTWNLHVLTLHKQLDYFVLFSSASSLFGTPGQGSYVAANAFVDSFAHYRRSLGLPAISINWGHLTHVGYVAERRELSELLTSRGQMGFSPKQAMEALGRMLQRKPVQTGVMRIDWQKWTNFASKVHVPQRLISLVTEQKESQGMEEGNRVREILLAANPEARSEIVQTYLREQVARVLGISAAKLDMDRPLNELGLDSLMAVQLKNRIESDLSLSLPTRELTENPTINRLSTAVLDQMGARRPGSEQEAPYTATTPATGRRGGIPSDSLVPLRANGSRPPLFCIHPAGGDVKIYKDLVDTLPADQPVYGIQSGLMVGAAAGRPSIESMAVSYANVICQRQPEGPYYLLGFSVGGFFATAIASLLEKRGRSVAFIGLVDCDVRCVDPSYPRHLMLRRFLTEMYGLLQRELGILQPVAAEKLEDEIGNLLEGLLPSTETQRVEGMLGWVKGQNYLRDDIRESVLREYLSRFVIHLGLLENFRPAVIRAPLFIWWARESLLDLNLSDRSWSRYSTGAVVEETLQGSHYEMMYSPAVQALAERVDEQLQRLQPSPRPISESTLNLITSQPAVFRTGR